MKEKENTLPKIITIIAIIGIIVIVINIAIIVCILGMFLIHGLVGSTRAREAARLTACKANLKNISTALEMYANDYNGIYPGGEEGGVIDNVGDPTATGGPIGADYFRKDYIGKKIICPTAKSANYRIRVGKAKIVKKQKGEVSVEQYYVIQCPAVHDPKVPDHRQGNMKGGSILHSRIGILYNLYNTDVNP
ncbi:MAG: type II secretion system protein [bacterium]